MTDQSKAIVGKLDPITTFLGPIPPDEYEQRRRIGVARNCGSFKAHRTSNGIARALAWTVAEIATEKLFAPAPVEELAEVAQLLLTLLTCADNAEIIGAGT